MQINLYFIISKATFAKKKYKNNNNFEFDSYLFLTKAKKLFTKNNKT